MTYRGVPEGVVRPDLVAADTYSAPTLTRQAVGGYVSFPVKFQNVSALDFGTPLKGRADATRRQQPAPPLPSSSTKAAC